jgi:hypothetical protein
LFERWWLLVVVVVVGVLSTVALFTDVRFPAVPGVIAAVFLLLVAQVLVARDFWRGRNNAQAALREVTEGGPAREAAARKTLVESLAALALEGERVARGEHPALPPEIAEESRPGIKREAVAAFVEEHSREWLDRTDAMLKQYADWVHLEWLRDSDIPPIPGNHPFVRTALRAEMYRRLNRLRNIRAEYQHWPPVLREQ